MRITFGSKGDFENTRSWFKRVTENKSSPAFDSIAKEGVKSLSSNTPVDTGETASGWSYDIDTKNNITEISWKNTAHPEASVNVAKLIELGHGTGTGGYVQPKPYIKNSMEPVWKSVDNNLVKELIK